MNDSLDPKEQSRKVAVFAYAAGIDAFHRNDRKIIHFLVESGFEPTVVQCKGVLRSSCPVMKADGLHNSDVLRRSLVCGRCKSTAKKLRNDYPSLDFVDLESLIGNKIENNNGLNLHRPPCSEKRFSIEWKQAVYSDLHTFKCTLETLSENYPKVVIESVKSANISFRAASRLFSGDSFLACFVNHAAYGTNLAIWEAARDAQVLPINQIGCADPAFRNEVINLEKYLLPLMNDEKLDAWRMFSKRPLAIPEITIVSDFLSQNFFGTKHFFYSPPKNRDKSEIAKQLGIKGEGIILALLGSPDERLAALAIEQANISEPESHISGTLRFISLIVEAATLNPDEKFVIRIHPRLLANYRDPVDSIFLQSIMEFLNDCPSNVIINHPSQDISLYDIVPLTKCVLSTGSTAGLHLAAIGLPVILCDPGYDYLIAPDIYFRIATEPQKINQAIQDISNYDLNLTSISAFRFLYFQLYRRAINVEEIFKDAKVSRTKTPNFKQWNLMFAATRQTTKVIQTLIMKFPTLKLLLLRFANQFSNYKESNHKVNLVTTFRLKKLLLSNESVDQQIQKEVLSTNHESSKERESIRHVIEQTRQNLDMSKLT